MFNPIKEEEEISFDQKIPSILDRIQEKIDYEAFLAKEANKQGTKPLNKPNQRKTHEFFKRNSDFLEKKALKIKIQAENTLLKDLSLCTFHPKTHKFTPKPQKKPCDIIYQDKHHII